LLWRHRRHGTRLQHRHYGKDLLKGSGEGSTETGEGEGLAMNRNIDRGAPSWGLPLANGQQWTFAAEDSLDPWLDAFARTLRLQRTQPAGEGPRLVFRMERGDVSPSGKAYDLGRVTLHREEAHPRWSCTFHRCRGRKRDIECMLLGLMAVYLETVERGGFPCHSGLLSWQGRGVLLAGHTGMGKSTICRRLLSTGSVRCDEETLVVRDRRGRYWGHPFPTWSRLYESPWSESWPTQEAIPLEGILFVFPAQEGRYLPVGPGEALARLTCLALDKSLRGCRGEKGNTLQEIRTKIFANVGELVSQLPTGRLNVSLAGDMDGEMNEACGRLWGNPFERIEKGVARRCVG